MEKAYDFKDLAGRLKSVGLEGGEEAAKQAYKELKEWLVQSATLSTTPLDNIAIPFINELDKVILPVIEKINPED